MPHSIRPLIAPLAAGALACCLALGGCGFFDLASNAFSQTGDAASQDVSDALADAAQGLSDAQEQIANTPADIAREFDDVDASSWGKAVVIDAATGAILGETTDKALLQRAFSGFSGAWDLASDEAMDAAGPALYTIELWTKETTKLGDDPADAADIKACSFTVYRDSDRIARLEVLDGNFISLNFIARTEGAVDGLKELAAAV